MQAVDLYDVPVTQKMLSLILTIRKAAELYRYETTLAEDFSSELPIDYVQRTQTLFFSTYAEFSRQVGLKLNQITFEGILRYEVPSEVLRTLFEQLPNTWVFNPYSGWRKI